MLHHKKNRKFGRVRKVRAGLIKSLMSELILNNKIKTTTAKAKEIRPLVEKLVTKARVGSLSAVRMVSAVLSKQAAIKLVKEVAPKFKNRNGGYTRILKLVPRKSDGAEMAIIEFVE